jgi:hypothetical protein
MGPDVLDQVLPQFGRRKTTDDLANERAKPADERAFSNAVPDQDLSQEAPILLKI